MCNESDGTSMTYARSCDGKQHPQLVVQSSSAQQPAVHAMPGQGPCHHLQGVHGATVPMCSLWLTPAGYGPRLPTG